MNKLWTRIFIFAVAFLLLLFVSGDFGLIDIQKTAIVLAVGVDASAQEGKLDVTAQIGSADSAGTAQASNITIAGVDTVGEAIARLNRRTGWYPTLVHCRLILLGSETARQDVFGILDYFLRSEYVEDSCLVALCADRAQGALQAQSPTDPLTANAIGKVFSGEAQKTGLVCVVNLRDFAKGYYGGSASGRLPVLTVLQEAKSDTPQSGAGGGAGAAFLPCAAGAGGESGGPQDVFDVSRTALFVGGRLAATLEPEETLALNLAEISTDFAYAAVQAEEEGGSVTYQLKVRVGGKSKRLRLEGDVPVCTVRVRASAQVIDTDRTAGLTEVAESAIVPQHVLRAAEEEYRAALQSAVQKAHAAGCDLFSLRQQLKRHYPRRYGELSAQLLQRVHIAYDVRFDTLR